MPGATAAATTGPSTARSSASARIARSWVDPSEWLPASCRGWSAPTCARRGASRSSPSWRGPLGRPPDPAEIARRVAPSGPANARVRDNARRTYEEAVRSRYRSYAQYLSQELSDADYVEIGPVRGCGGVRRYYSGQHLRRGGGGVQRDGGQLRVARVVAVRARMGARTRREGPARRGTPARSPESPAAPRARQGSGAAPDPRGPRPRPAPCIRPTKTCAPPAPPPIAEADQVRCRRSCSLRYRACLARCRDQPVTGGGYDACAYECSDGSVSCRGACGGALASP